MKAIIDKFRKFYEEDTQGKVSGAEICLFYTTLILFGIVAAAIIFCPKLLSTKQLMVLSAPLFLWVFMRASRKDMKATAYLLAGLFGALGGALVSILMR